ncbi:unnamed protein product [Darwinula stevensoni]|uniref:Uncharacterized protein n=1 Tax=Darwinula stevensoni TaxID=69355 RepID=A0A7R9AF88_9CRUS|nr:unnamed protein product [Darwinula stevensoni]CAG0902362.1 unnamed protein product [Darwinula stevensoni]
MSSLSRNSSAKSIPQEGKENESSPTHADVKQMLEGTECHFTWKPVEHGHIPPGCSFIAKIKDKRIIYERGNEQFLMVTYDLLLAYEHGRQEDLSKARDILQRVQRKIANMDVATSEEKEALQYLTSCNLANVNFLMGDPDTAREGLLKTKKYSESPERVKAQILCAKAAAYSEYSKESFSYSLELYREGVILDQGNYNLHFGVGMILRRIRRIETVDGIPTEEEEMAMRKAIEMRRCHSSLIFLAESLREHARALAIRKISRHRIPELNGEALALYIEVYKDPSADGKTLVRCGDGFMKLPKHMRDLQKAEECFLKAYALCPNNNMVNHKLGVFYIEVKESHILAEKYLLAAIDPSNGKGNFAAHATYVNLKLMDDPLFDVSTEWQVMLERYPDIFDQIYLHISQMQYFSQYDPGTGLHHAKDTLDALVQLKKPIQTFGCTHHLSHDGRRLKLRYPPRNYAHVHLLDGLQYLQRRLPEKRVVIESMMEKLRMWMDSYVIEPENVRYE